MAERDRGTRTVVREALPWAQRVQEDAGTLRWGPVRLTTDDAASRAGLDRVPSGVGDRPLSVHVRVAQPGEPRQRAQGYQLTLRDEPDGPVMEVVAADGAGMRYGARAAAALLTAGHAAGLPPLRVDDWPAVPRRGYMECFYGETWSTEDRLTMLDWAARWGLNTYCYGPAADPRTGADWASRYDAADLAEFATVTRAARELGVDTYWRISPSAPLDPVRGARLSSADAVAALADKLLRLAGIGVRGFILAFDDLSSGLVHDADRIAFAADPHPVAAAQASFVNAVAEAVRRAADVDIICCPTLYWGVADVGGYRRRLGELLDPAVEVCWTGPEVVAATIDAAGSRAVAEQYGRDAVWLWDNYPVNDWDSTPGIEAAPRPRRMMLGPLRRRDVDVAGALTAITANCGTEAAAAMPTLATVAAWGWNPDRYDPTSAWDRAVTLAFADCGCRADAEDCATHFRGFADLHELSPLAPHARGWLRPAVSAFLSTGSDVDRTRAELRQRLDRARVHAVRLASCGSPTAWALRGWAAKLAVEVDAADAAVEVIAAERDGRAAPPPDTVARLRPISALATTGEAAGGALAPLIDYGRIITGPTAPSPDFVGRREPAHTGEPA